MVSCSGVDKQHCLKTFGKASEFPLEATVYEFLWKFAQTRQHTINK